MSLWIQHLLVGAAVLASLLLVAFQVRSTFRGSGKIGQCCAKGCSVQKKPPGERVVFMPAELLGRKKK